MVTKKIEEMEQLPISLLPDDWPLPVKLAWQDNTNTTNITSETLNLTLSETETIKQNQASQASELSVLSQDVQAQKQDLATAKDEAAKALQASATNKTDIGTNSTAIQKLQNEIQNLPTDDKLQQEVTANTNDIIKLKSEIQNLPSDAKLEQEIQANKTDIATNTTSIADNLTAIQKLREDVAAGYPGTDYVVEYKKYSNGFYRLYASGYCEQGGVLQVSNMAGTYPHGGEYPYWRPFEVMDGLVILGTMENATSSVRGDISTPTNNNPKTHFRVYLRTYAGARVDNFKSYYRWYAAGITAKPPKAPVTPLPQAVDYIVEQRREADGRWYRKYASGYIEQGGKAITKVGLQFLTVDYLTPFTDITSLLFVGHFGGAASASYVTAGPAPAPNELTAVQLALRNPDDTIYTKTAEPIRYMVTGY